ncbi:hypothetical protein Trydic_g4658 [Trypoxylus dichotomus]
MHKIPPGEIANKIKEINRFRKEFQHTRYPPLKENPNRLRRQIQENIEMYRLKRTTTTILSRKGCSGTLWRRSTG